MQSVVLGINIPQMKNIQLLLTTMREVTDSFT